jgi:hypothetical protein
MVNAKKAKKSGNFIDLSDEAQSTIQRDDENLRDVSAPSTTKDVFSASQSFVCAIPTQLGDVDVQDVAEF